VPDTLMLPIWMRTEGELLIPSQQEHKPARAPGSLPSGDRNRVATRHGCDAGGRSGVPYSKAQSRTMIILLGLIVLIAVLVLIIVAVTQSSKNPRD
jgi:hypothetical protein